MTLNTSSLQTPQFKSYTYLDAYSRINGLVVVGEGLADRHLRLLARAIPEDQPELQRLLPASRQQREFCPVETHPQRRRPELLP
mgnify:CR=1 FL=1